MKSLFLIFKWILCALLILIYTSSFALEGAEDAIDTLYHHLGVKNKLEFSELPYGFADSNPGISSRLNKPTLQKIENAALHDNNSYAQWVIGKLYEVKLKRVSDQHPLQTAQKFYTLAVSQNFREAEFDLGNMIRNGFNKDPSEYQWEDLITQSAQSGEPRAQTMMALYCTPNLLEKTSLLEKAEAQNYAYAAFNLGNEFYNLASEDVTDGRSYIENLSHAYAHYKKTVQILDQWGLKNCGHICNHIHGEGISGWWSGLGHVKIYEHACYLRSESQTKLNRMTPCEIL
ncbi:MAG: sel1 repeat family protein [Proteobacteria bacterium]|nr:sel1 repeat family protein [Pseudomonadota bacterium]